MVGMEFFTILMRPQPVMEAEKKNADTMKGVKTVALVGAIYGLLLALAQVVLGGLNFLGGNAGMGALFAGLGIVSIIILPIVFALLMVIFSVILIGVVWIVAKLLGGKGTFADNYYLYSRLAFPTFVIGAVLFILGLIPVVGVLFGLISFVFNIYMLYVFVILVSVANKVSKARAIVILLIPAVIFFILFVVVIGAALLAAIGGAAMMQ